MEQNTNPATPAQGAATPGNGAPVQSNPSTAPQPTTTQGQGGQPEGFVTIPTKEYAELQRAKARQISFDRRKEFNRSKPNQPSIPGDADPELAQRIQEDQMAKEELERRALKAEITLGVRDILDKEEYKALPASTKALIIKNPHMLSEADNAQEALLDIEDFVREQVAGLNLPPQPNQNQTNQPGQGTSNTPAGHETPPVNSSGAPAPTSGVELEDPSKLTGQARSRAILRNKIKEVSRGTKQN